jgi:hypothetical protein
MHGGDYLPFLSSILQTGTHIQTFWEKPMMVGLLRPHVPNESRCDWEMAAAQLSQCTNIASCFTYSLLDSKSFSLGLKTETALL